MQSSEILQRLQAVAASERISLLIAYIQGEVAKVLGLEPSNLPDPQQGFFDMGMDSLMAAEFKNRLEVSFETSVPVTLMFDFPTIKDLAWYIAKQVMGWELPATGETELSKGELVLTEALSEVEQLSEDGVEVSLAEELAKLETFLKKN